MDWLGCEVQETAPKTGSYLPTEAFISVGPKTMKDVTREWTFKRQERRKYGENKGGLLRSICEVTILLHWLRGQDGANITREKEGKNGRGREEEGEKERHTGKYHRGRSETPTRS
jgi:hypothetical protein